MNNDNCNQQVVAGHLYIARDTSANKACNVDFGVCCHVLKVVGDEVAINISRSQCSINALTNLGTFLGNFAKDLGSPEPNRAYVYENMPKGWKRYPKDFM